MSSDRAEARVADLVLEKPSRARVFEQLGIDYCCGGKRPLAQACADRGLEVEAVVAALDATLEPDTEDVDWRDRPLEELCGHIVGRHHAYLREELPSLLELVAKVARAHGAAHPELHEVQEVFAGAAEELEQHMVKEETILFPVCVALERGIDSPFPAGSVGGPIDVMEHEHDTVAAALARLRELTGGYEPPAGACTSYRAMLGRLATLEQDTHRHVHEENNILFPRTMELDAAAL
jgi:regulator of cell morphogenesis and NO signaling